jgi:molybdate transport system ATP-binding protein
MITLELKKRLKLSDGVKELDIRIDVESGKIVTIFGKSGEGKTTILRMIAGLTKADSGYIKVNGKFWFNSDLKIDLPPQKRKIGFVFQNYALFPNMTAEENILFGMGKKDLAFLEELIELMELQNVRKLKPDKLSGGQKQRVALARAMARKPEILLLDEPLSALDWEMRRKLQDEIKNINKKFKTTIFLVSHNVDEVVRLSDRVFYLNNGKIEKEGKPEEVFSYLGIIS